MDKIKKYQNAISEFLNENAKMTYANAPEIEFQVICDYENNHYQLLEIGWHGYKFVHEAVFHFDIKNGKIWIQKNETELLVGDQLVSKGVSRDDIVIGFIPESARPYSGFAIL